MNEDFKIKVLWVDDEPNEDFMNEAYEEGLDLDNVICVEDGIAKVNNPKKSYDAIILDGNCRIKHDFSEQPSLNALTEAINTLLKKAPNLPWFVYTAANYEGSNSLDWIIKTAGNREYDDKSFYVKSADRYIMYDHIKKAVANMPTTIVKEKYSDVLKVYSSPEFIQLLIGLEQGSMALDSNVPNTVRKILEWVMGYLNQEGILPVLFTGTNLSECSVCLGMMRGFIPAYIQRSVHHCEELSNEGSHRDSNTNKIIREGNAPYLNMSLVVDLLNILHWCGTLSKDIENNRKLSFKSYTSNKNISHPGIVKNENGMLKLDGIMVSIADKTLKEGDIVVKVKGTGNRQDKYVKLAFIEDL